MRNLFRHDSAAQPSDQPPVATPNAGVSQRRLADYQYAAVDVETTGLFPGGHDRIIELGVVLFDLTGGACAEYETIVNPHRDLGPHQIHGLSMAELSLAPSFETVCQNVASLLAGRVLIAHNASFDVRFLQAEFRRASAGSPEFPNVCTMRLAAEAGLGQRRLSALCLHFGLSQTGPHTAIGDARATAGIFRAWYASDPSNRAKDLRSCGCAGEPTPRSSQDPPQMAWQSVTRSDASRLAAAARGYLPTLVDSLAASIDTSSFTEAEYIDLLDRALEDRHLSAQEAEGLFAFAVSEGLSKLAVGRLHREFFETLMIQAWADGVVSAVEAADLRLVGEFLGLDADTVNGAISSQPPGPAAEGRGQTNELARLPPGTTVCFTGTLHATVLGALITRDQAHLLATRAGLVVLEGVSKKLDVLIVADPQSASGKAQKARSYGTRIIAEAVFWRSIGAETD